MSPLSCYVQRYYDSHYLGNGRNVGKMNLMRNGLVFATFLGSCLCIGLLAASLGTRYWIVSSATIPNRNGSSGNIFFGLFSGEQNLNYGIGLRTYQISVSSEMGKTNAYYYWLGTVCCMFAAIGFGATSAVLAVINSATAPIFSLNGIPGLYLWNVVSILFQIWAVSFWGFLFHKKPWYSILNSADNSVSWTTEGKAFFGLSYWLVFASIFVQVINIIFIYLATSDTRQKKKAAKPVIEEKTNGAIMLY